MNGGPREDGGGTDRERLNYFYGSTSFWVEAEEVCIRLRVSESNQLLDALLDRSGVTRWAYVTAHNPRSVMLGTEENERRHGELLVRVRSLGLKAMEGWGVGDEGDWPPERSVLILGVAEGLAQNLGGEFDQNAVVVGQLGRAPELVSCRRVDRA